ncbi:MAG: hypothetical protein JNL02_15460 [Saprospiraceae bacterium]|nr:hypothetical protein [Saprospiraceae bacterium]
MLRIICLPLLVLLWMLPAIRLNAQDDLYNKYFDKGRNAQESGSFEVAVGYYRAAAECKGIRPEEVEKADAMVRYATKQLDSVLNVARVTSLVNETVTHALNQEKSDPTLAVRLSDEACRISSNSNQLAVDVRSGLLENKGSAFYSTAIDCGCPVSALAVSPDNKFLAIGCGDYGEVKLYNIETGDFRTLQESSTGKPARVTHLAYSNAGDQLAAGIDKGTIFVWKLEDLSKGKITGNKMNLAPGLVGLAFSPNGDTLLTAIGEVVAFWSPRLTRRSPLHFIDLQDPILSLACSPEGTIACGFNNFTVKYWPYQDHKQFVELTGHRQEVISVQFSRDGEYLITGSADHTAKLWQVRSGALLRTFTGHPESVSAVAFANKTQEIMTVGEDHRVILWDWNGATVQTLPCSPEFTGATALAPNDQFIATGDEEGYVRLWSINRESNLANTPHIDEITSLAVAPGDNLFLTGSKDHTAKIWETETGDVLWTFMADDEVSAVDWARNGSSFMLGLWNGTIHLFDQDRLLIGTFTGLHTSSITSIAFSPDGRYFISGSRDGTAKVWELQGSNQPRLISSVKHNRPVTSVAWSPTGAFVASGSIEGVKICPWNSPRPVNKPIIAGGDVLNIRFSNSGKEILICGKFGTVQLLTLKGKLKEKLNYNTVEVDIVAGDFSSYDNTLALGTNKGALRIISIKKNQSTKKVSDKVQTGQVMSIRWLRSKSQFLCAGGDGRIRLFNDELKLMRVYRGHVGDLTFGVTPSDKKYFITTSTDQIPGNSEISTTIKYWNARTNRELTAYENTNTVTAIRTYVPNGTIILMGVYSIKGRKTTAGLYRQVFAPNKRSVTDFPITTFPGKITAITSIYKPTAKYYAACDDKGNLKIFDHTHNLNEERRFAEPLTALNFSPLTGQYLAVCGTTSSSDVGVKNPVYVWEWQQDRFIDTLYHNWAVRSVAFSADEKIMATSDDGGIIRFWNPANGKLLKTCVNDQNPLMEQDTTFNLNFSPNGKYLLSTDAGGFVRLWDATANPGAVFCLLELSLENDKIVAADFISNDSIVVFGKRRGIVILPNRLNLLDRENAVIAPLTLKQRIDYNIPPEIEDCLDPKKPEMLIECVAFYIEKYNEDQDPAAFERADSIFNRLTPEQLKNDALLNDFASLYDAKRRELEEDNQFFNLVYVSQRRLQTAEYLFALDTNSNTNRSRLVDSYWYLSWYQIATGDYENAKVSADKGLRVPGNYRMQKGIVSNKLLADLLLADDEKEYDTARKAYLSYADKPLSEDKSFGDFFEKDFDDLEKINPNLPKTQRENIRRIRKDIRRKSD